MQVTKIGIDTQQNVIAKKNNNQTSVNFCKNESTKYPQEASTGKKIGVGIASWFVPGLGQFINNDTKKGLAMFGAWAIIRIIINSTKTRNVLEILRLVNFGIGIYSIVDAVKNAKPSNS